MQRLLVSVSLLAVVSLAVSVTCVVTADEKPKAAELDKAQNRVGPAKQSLTSGAIVVQSAAVKPSPDDAAIRATGEALVKAYQKHDAKGFAALFTAEGEYVDDTESLFHGRDAIEKEFVTFFQANPETTIQVAFDAIRTIAPGVVKIQGSTSFRLKPADKPASGRCSLICVKDGARWLIASLREIEASESRTHHDHVRQLEWMVGEWINEGQRAEIHFSCRWDQTGNFLLRDFSIQAGGLKVISGTQRIGYDPVSDHLKAWTFDSEGGYSDGYLRQDNGVWVLHTSGVTGGGQMASGTEIFSPVDSHRITWDSVDRIIAGKRIADTGQITVVRKPPAPAPAAVSISKQPEK